MAQLDATPGQSQDDWQRQVDTMQKKNASMREALAKVWGVGEGHNPFKEDEHSPDEKKKKVKIDTKTMTGKPITKVTEIDRDEQIIALRKQLEEIKPWSAVFDPAFVKNLSGPNVKKAANKMELAEMLMQDMENFKRQHDLERLVMCWCGSTEVYQEDMDHAAFKTIEGFEKALKDNLSIIPP